MNAPCHQNLILYFVYRMKGVGGAPPSIPFWALVGWKAKAPGVFVGFKNCQIYIILVLFLNILFQTLKYNNYLCSSQIIITNKIMTFKNSTVGGFAGICEPH